MEDRQRIVCERGWLRVKDEFGRARYIRFSSFDQNNDKSYVGRNGTVDGVALLRLSYPAGCALAFVAELEDFSGEVPQGICSNPVQLTVATETKLLLNITNSGSQHTFRGWLKRTSNGEDVSGQTVALKVNETAYVFSTTDDGGFNTALDLKPLNNKKTTFVILVGYDSSTPLNVMA